MTCYCPFPGCGAQATYAAVKPTECPKCHQAYADAFKVATAAITPTVPVAPPARRLARPEPVRPLTKSELLARREEVGIRAARAAAKGPDDEDEEDDDGDFGLGEADTVDIHAARADARRLAQTIQAQGGMADLIISQMEVAGEGPVKAGDYIQIVDAPAAKTKPARRSRKGAK